MSQINIEELEKWFENFESPLIAYAYQILKDREEARDQVQEAFKRILDHEDKIEFPKAWLYRTVRNLSISYLRKRKKVQHEGESKQLDFFANQMEKNQDRENPLQKIERTEKVGRVSHFISLLPEESKNLLQMKFEKKLSYNQIASETGLSVGNVGYKLHHLLKELADELQAEGIT
jgi:RNA polymerase sigma-70 factor (ECF subfamily)